MRLQESVTQNRGGFPCRLQGGISLQSTVLFCCSLSPRIGRTTKSNLVGFGVCNTHETSLIPFLIEISAPKWANNHLLLLFVGSWCLWSTRQFQTLHLTAVTNWFHHHLSMAYNYGGLFKWKKGAFVLRMHLKTPQCSFDFFTSIWLPWWQHITCVPHRPKFLHLAKVQPVFFKKNILRPKFPSHKKIKWMDPIEQRGPFICRGQMHWHRVS